jgi:hypothetical protein
LLEVGAITIGLSYFAPRISVAMSMVRERWRADMRDQRTRGQVLKETAAARDPISLG